VGGKKERKTKKIKEKRIRKERKEKIGSMAQRTSYTMNTNVPSMGKSGQIVQVASNLHAVVRL
jgi:hypothetical protein